MIDVNLNGTYLVIFAIKDEMIARQFGRIVVISSVAAFLPRRRLIHYATAKAGVISLVRCCADAFASANVRVNGIAPGLVETEMLHVLSDEAIQKYVEETPLGRVDQPAENARAVRFPSVTSRASSRGTLIASGGRVMLP